MQENATKGVIGIFIGIMTYVYNNITIPVIILVMFILNDYFSGLLVALKTGKFDPKKGAWGAVTKVCYGLVVGMCFLLDYTIISVTKEMGIVFPIKALFGVVITLIFIGNEGLSGARNYIVLGVPVPDILLKGFGLVKNEAGKIIRIPKEEGEEQEHGL